jgi:hypothetical protein
MVSLILNDQSYTLFGHFHKKYIKKKINPFYKKYSLNLFFIKYTIPFVSLLNKIKWYLDQKKIKNQMIYSNDSALIRKTNIFLMISKVNFRIKHKILE